MAKAANGGRLPGLTTNQCEGVPRSVTIPRTTSTQQRDSAVRSIFGGSPPYQTAPRRHYISPHVSFFLRIGPRIPAKRTQGEDRFSQSRGTEGTPLSATHSPHSPPALHVPYVPPARCHNGMPTDLSFIPPPLAVGETGPALPSLSLLTKTRVGPDAWPVRAHSPSPPGTNKRTVPSPPAIHTHKHREEGGAMSAPIEHVDQEDF